MLPKPPSPFDIFLGISLIAGISAFHAYKSGWYELAELYKTDLKLADDSIASKVKNYRCRIGRKPDDCVTGPRNIAFLDTGIYLNAGTSSIHIFNRIKPPLLISWQEISQHEIVGGKHHFYFGNPTVSVLILSTKAVGELEQLSGISISDRINNNL